MFQENNKGESKILSQIVNKIDAQPQATNSFRRSLTDEQKQLVAQLLIFLNPTGAQVKGRYFKQTWAADNARSEILISSIEVFVEHGLADATVQHILEAADVSRRTFYKYFRNKTDVLKTLYELSSDLIIDQVERSLDEQTTVAGIIDYIVDSSIKFSRKLGPIVLLLQLQALNNESPLAPLRSVAQKRLLKAVKRALARVSNVKIDENILHIEIWSLESMVLELLKADEALVKTGLGAAKVDDDTIDTKVIVDKYKEIFKISFKHSIFVAGESIMSDASNQEVATAFVAAE